MFLVIAEWNKQFHPDRVNETETELEATTLVDKLINSMPEGLEAPNAFYVSHPGVEGKYIIVNPADKTISVDTDKLAQDKVKQSAMDELRKLESAISSRRYREAIAGADGGWLANQESLIATERGKL